MELAWKLTELDQIVYGTLGFGSRLARLAHADHTLVSFPPRLPPPCRQAPETMELAWKLTELDQIVYAAGLARFYDDVRAIENATGTRILCGEFESRVNATGATIKPSVDI